MSKMKVYFQESQEMQQNEVKVITHPAERSKWNPIREAIGQLDTELIVIQASNNRNVMVKLSAVTAIESEERMCGVRVITGDRYLLNKRLKYVEKELEDVSLVRINNQTIINIRHISNFAAASHARIQVNLTDGSSYYVSRFYIQNFRRRL
ncbi:LytTR family transcriptional regulator [Paenibacillus barcinonensis]|uniref:LytTR family transcriptional regulator n=2 Tax=Paenibacillus barcinonensis TaxID=198119 RepID=A0ABX6QA45_PAEBA|nr:LytTR family transcriptional regulator [Paenibacillus barcinonensis]